MTEIEVSSLDGRYEGHRLRDRAAAARLLAKRAGRPVKFKHSRRDSFHDTRQPALYHCKVGAKADGTHPKGTIYFLKNDKGRLAIVVSDETLAELKLGQVARVLVVTPASLSSRTLPSRLNLARRKRFAPKVLVSITWAPASGM